jgi:hypothetical protein
MIGRRREFLGWLGAGTVAVLTGRGMGAQIAGDGVRLRTGSSLTPVSRDWDVTWVDRIHGDARAVFDVPSPGEGDGVWRAGRWREDYAEVYGVDAGDVTPVLVIRHEAIQLIMDDEYWKHFDVGKRLKMHSHAGKGWTETNPVSGAAKDSGGDFDRYSLQYFMAHGGIVLACHMAFRGRVVPDYVKSDGLDDAAAEERAREHIIPGIILQPSGVFAVLRAQQAGCSYLLAS